MSGWIFTGLIIVLGWWVTIKFWNWWDRNDHR